VPDSLTPDIDVLIKQLRGDIFMRWMKQAQQQALLEWRDRKIAPGLAARFEDAGNKFYEFTNRTGKYDSQKGYLPDFVRTGSLRDSMKMREARSQNNTTEAITRLKYGGGALNLLVDKFGVKSVTRIPTVVVTSIPAYTRIEKKTGATVHVTGYYAERHGVHVTTTHASKSYSAEFAEFSKDAPWLKQRVGEIFKAKVRAATIKNGKIVTRNNSGYATQGQVSFGSD